MTNQDYYLKNDQYSRFLESHTTENYELICDLVLKYSDEKDRIIDVGCGTGKVVHILSKRRPYIEGYEISKTSLLLAKKKWMNCNLYDGYNIPVGSDSIDLVFSNNVLEHVDKPLEFLDEQRRVLKKNGYLIVICPNFLSITNNYHWHTAGILRKFLNIITLLNLLINKSSEIDKMDVINNPIFMPDDDACNVTNPISIINWSKDKGMKIEYWSGQKMKRYSYLWKIFDSRFLRYLFGTCIFVFRKI